MVSTAPKKLRIFWVAFALILVQPSFQVTEGALFAGKPAEASGDVRRVPAIGFEAQQLLIQANQALRQNNLAEAKIAVTEVSKLQHYNEFVEAASSVILADIAIQEGDLAAAVLMYKNILKLRSSIHPAFEYTVMTKLAELHAVHGDILGAMEYGKFLQTQFEDVMKAHPFPQSTASLLAKLYFAQEDYVAAHKYAGVSLNSDFEFGIRFGVAEVERPEGEVCLLLRIQSAALAALGRPNEGIEPTLAPKCAGAQETLTRAALLELMAANAISKEAKGLLGNIQLPKSRQRDAFSDFEGFAALETLQQYVYQGKLEKAQQALSAVPTTPDWSPYERLVALLLEASLAEKAGDNERVAGILEAAFELDYEWPQVVREKLQEKLMASYLEVGDVQAAAPIIDELVVKRGAAFECAALEATLSHSEADKNVGQQPSVCGLYSRPTYKSTMSILSLTRGLRDYEIRSFLPVEHKAPKFPIGVEAANRGGYVVLEFNTSKKGKVIANRISVVESSPEGVFEAAAIEAVRAFKYPVLRVAGEKRGIRNIRFRFDFEVTD